MKFATKKEVVDFYNNGYLIRSFKDTPKFREFKKMLSDIRDGKIKEGYHWQINSSYWERCSDFRPDIHTYDPLLFDVFAEQHMHESMCEITGIQDLFLGYIKLRLNLHGKAYTTWHRDTNYYYGTTKGATPSMIGINYYPNLGDTSEPSLTVWPGTHHIQNRYKIFDWATVHLTRGVPIYTNDDEYLLFDTGILHKLMPIHSEKGSLRIISQFVRECQSDIYAGREALHAMYRDKVINHPLI